jgi:hypothetical protein
MRFAVVLLCIADATTTRAHQPPETTVPRYVISGHVVDPERLRSDDDRLMLGQERDGSFSSVPVPIEADGSFVTSPVRSGTYVIEMLRVSSQCPGRRRSRSRSSGTGDVSGVTVEVRRDPPEGSLLQRCPADTWSPRFRKTHSAPGRLHIRASCDSLSMECRST